MLQTASSHFATEMARLTQAVEDTLKDLLPRPQGPESPLLEAMRHAVLTGGNRLRAFLVCQSGRLLGADERAMLRIAAAVECLHAHALIHDDLPSMGDGRRRRSRPVTHQAFDEATAILAGNALLALSFSIVSSPKTCPDPFIRGSLVSHMSDAIGHGGMIGGQMIDYACRQQDMDIGTLTRLQRMKTGALIAFSCETGPLIARASEDMAGAMNGYAHDLALALQIMDDLADYAAPPPAADNENAGPSAVEPVPAPPPELAETPGRATFLPVLGEERARNQAGLLARQAIRHLDMFDEKADPLRSLAGFVIGEGA
ncbi:MAG: polyprenyl synthetase family protein [Alphaproteobacteria bacterium]